MYLAVLESLDCPMPPDYKDSSYIGIFLRRMSAIDEQYARVKVGTRIEVLKRGISNTIYVPQIITRPEIEVIFPTHAIQIGLIPHYEHYRVAKYFVLEK